MLTLTALLCSSVATATTHQLSDGQALSSLTLNSNDIVEISGTVAGRVALPDGLTGLIIRAAPGQEGIATLKMSGFSGIGLELGENNDVTLEHLVLTSEGASVGLLEVGAGSELLAENVVFRDVVFGSAFGACLRVLNGGTATVRDSEFEDCRSGGGDGGAVFVLDSTADFVNTDFTDNSANALGGAIYALNSDLTVDGGEFSLNRVSMSNGYGGSVYLVGGEAMFDSVSFSAGSASRGGHLAALDAELSLVDCELGVVQENGGGGQLHYFNDQPGLELRVRGGIWVDGYTSGYGGGMLLEGSELDVAVDDVLFSDAGGPNATGGAVAARGAGVVTLIDTVVEEGSVAKAAAIFAERDGSGLDVEVKGGVWLNLTSAGEAAGLWSSGAGVTVHADAAGNAMHIEGLNAASRGVFHVQGPAELFSLSGVDIKGVLTTNGSALGEVSEMNRVELKSVWVSGVSGGTQGPGSLFVHDSGELAVLDDSSFDGVGSDPGLQSRNGGAIAAQNVTRVEIRDSAFVEYTSGGHGGALAMFGPGDLVLDGVDFVDNTALESSDGGSVYRFGPGFVTLEDVSVLRGFARRGGHLYVDASSGAGVVDVRNSTFVGGTATSSVGGTFGGSMALQGELGVAMHGVTFAYNEAEDDGGALWMSGSAGVELDGSTFCNNTAFFGSGGALGAVDIEGDLQIEGTVFAFNLADEKGGAVFGSSPGTLRIENNSLVANQSIEGAALWAEGMRSDGHFVQNLVGWNTEEEAVHLGGPVGELDWNAWFSNTGDLQGPSHGTASLLEVDPQVVDFDPAVSTCEDLDLHLRPNSPLLDAGDPNRTDSDGGPADIGAFEGGAVSDVDGDGFDAVSAGGEDCDDTDPGVSPEAEERCNDVDDDCDGDVDEDALDGLPAYQDGDGDGYGTHEVVACLDENGELPPGLAPDGEDCDDGETAVNPGADEVCNGVDDDCVDGIDNGAPGLVSAYPDEDGDTYGAEGSAVEVCEDANGDLPDGYSRSGNDCADDLKDVNPGSQEVCDGVDNDCSDGIDVGASDAAAWFPDSDGDGSGDIAGSSVSACEAPEGYADNDDDCDDSTAARAPTNTEICDDLGVDEDCDGLVDVDDPDVTTGSGFVDADEDGFGAEGTDELVRCDASDLAGQAGDCDDTNGAVNPDATEVADDGVDQDCDGSDLTSGDTGQPDDTDDTDEPVDTGAEPVAPHTVLFLSGGCSSTGGAPLWSGLLGLCWLGATRRRRVGPV